MLCPKCESAESVVNDSRYKDRYGVPYEYIRRRRRCLNCEFKFTTYEETKKPEDFVTQKAVRILRRIETLIGEIDLEV